MRGPEVGAASLLGVDDKQGRSAGDRCHNPGETTTWLSCEALDFSRLSLPGLTVPPFPKQQVLKSPC